MKELLVKAIESQRFINQDTLRGTFRECGHRITPKRIWMEGHQITWMKDGKKLFSEMVCHYAAWTYVYILSKNPKFIPDRRFQQILDLYGIKKLLPKMHDLFYERIDEDKNDIELYKKMGPFDYKIKKYYETQIKELEKKEERKNLLNEFLENENNSPKEKTRMMYIL